MKSEVDVYVSPELKVHVLDPHAHARSRWTPCRIGHHVEFTTDKLESYCIASWEPVIYDVLLVAAAVEFADRTLKRPALSWQRDFRLLVPVHEPARWNEKPVLDALHDSLDFLTGDRWHIEFVERMAPLGEPKQQHFSLPSSVEAVIPYSDGMDSRCVAGLLDRTLGDRLIRVRLGSRIGDAKTLAKERQPFTSIPYRVHSGERESSARSRGFKFALISGLAAYLAQSAAESSCPRAGRARSGRPCYRGSRLSTITGAIRCLPAAWRGFSKRLFGHKLAFDFHATLAHQGRDAAAISPRMKSGDSWARPGRAGSRTRQVSVDGKKRQCGICAACMLRRMSVHAAGLKEPAETYVWGNLGAARFERGAAPSFPKRRSPALARICDRRHAASRPSRRACGIRARMRALLDLSSFQLAGSLGIERDGGPRQA